MYPYLNIPIFWTPKKGLFVASLMPGTHSHWGIFSVRRSQRLATFAYCITYGEENSLIAATGVQIAGFKQARYQRLKSKCRYATASHYTSARGYSHCGHDGSACRNFQKQPPKVTNMGVAPAYFNPWAKSNQRNGRKQVIATCNRQLDVLCVL